MRTGNRREPETRHLQIQRSLRKVGLRVTPQSTALTALLDRSEGRPVTAEVLGVLKAHFRVSRATVTNALRQFEQETVRYSSIQESLVRDGSPDRAAALRERENKRSRAA